LNKRGWPYPCERIFPSLNLFSVQINIAVARGVVVTRERKSLCELTGRKCSPHRRVRK